MSKALVPAAESRLPELSDEEAQDLSLEDRRAEAWYMASTGHSQTAIARKLGVTRRTIQKDLAHEANERLSRRELVDEELERIVGVMEAVVEESWKAHRNALEKNPSSLAGSNYLRLVLDAAREVANLRGLTRSVGETSTGGTAQVVVRIGGGEGGRENTIEIGAQVK